MNASILSIGTEITSGQILNSNAQWISDQLKKLGVEIAYHIAVPDHRDLILQSLKFVEHTNFIFVTGGLGPTSDDFTRDVVAKWANVNMVFDPASFEHIEKRLLIRGIPVRESQKQQCYFPKSAKILFNQNGTANGFFFDSANKNKVFVLPGPPKEIAGIWQDHIAAMMDKFCTHIDALITESWDCLGLGESEIAHLTETSTLNCPFEKAYRVHIPYVEVKISYKKSQYDEARNWVEKIEKTLAPHTVARNGEDLAQKAIDVLVKYSKVCFCDSYLQSFILARLNKLTRRLLDQNKINFINDEKDIPQNSDFIVEIKKSAPHEISLALNGSQKTIVTPPWLHFSEEREKQFFTEMVFIELCKA